MSVWVYDPVTSIVIDYGIGESLTYLPAKGYIHLRGQPEGALPAGDDPTWYWWNGSAIVKRNLMAYNPRAAERELLLTRISASALLTNEQKTILTQIVALIV